MGNWTSSFKTYEEESNKAKLAEEKSADWKAAMKKKDMAIKECWKEDRLRTKDALTGGEREKARRQRAERARQVEVQRQLLMSGKSWVEHKETPVT